MWRPDGKELFYVAGDRRLMAVAVKAQEQKGRFVLAADLPKALFDTGTKFSTRRPYAASPDGQRFLVVTQAAGKEPEPISVVVNWVVALKQ